MPNRKLAIEWWPVGRLTPYPTNPRIISEGAVAKVAASIETFGWRQPIVVDPQGVVVVGHTRLKAAQQLGLDTVPVHVADLDEDAARAYRIADNRTNEESRWEPGALELEIGALRDVEFNLGVLGFDPGQLEGIMLSDTAPGSLGDQGQLDTTSTRECTCPACGHVFAP